MSNPVAGWTTRVLADGLGLFPPEGETLGGVRIRDRRRPLRAVSTIVGKAVRESRLGDPAVRATERLETAEGEHGALVVASGTVDGTQCERCTGLIFGDDFYTQIDSATAEPSRFANFRQLVRELVVTYAVGLGRDRMRRPMYQPPPGWRGYPRGLTTIWYPPGFPANEIALTVSPVAPIRRSASLVRDVELQAALERPFSALTPMPQTRHGLVGGFAEFLADEPCRVVVHLEDDIYIYGVQLQAPRAVLADLKPTLDALVDSLEPIPQPIIGSASDVLSHWAD